MTIWQFDPTFTRARCWNSHAKKKKPSTNTKWQFDPTFIKWQFDPTFIRWQFDLGFKATRPPGDMDRARNKNRVTIWQYDPAMGAKLTTWANKGKPYRIRLSFLGPRVGPQDFG